MEYRPLGRTGLQVSALGIGTEHLHRAGAGDVAAILDRAIERGINYFDLVWSFPDYRDRLSAGLRGRRGQVVLTCHLNSAVKNGQYWHTNNIPACEQVVADFLARFDTDYVDVLFVHNVNGQREYDALLRPGGLFELAHRFKEQGVARAVGLSGHLSTVCIQPVRAGLIDVLMFPVNLSGHAEPARRALLQACAEQGVGVVAMKAFGGGRLLEANHTVQFSRYQTGGPTFKKKVPRSVTPVRCLSYVLTQPAVATTVAGVSTRDELEATLAYLDAGPEARDFGEVLAGLEAYLEGECVYCNHCLPCPAGIDIGLVSRLADTYSPALQGPRAQYAALAAPASACTRCGACVRRCPFGVDVLAIIDRAVALYEAA